MLPSRNFVVFVVVVALTVLISACSKPGELSDREASNVLQQKLFEKANFTQIPLGRVHFMTGLEAGLGRPEKPAQNKFHPLRLESAKALAAIGLTRLEKINSLDFTSSTYEIALTPAGEKAIDHRDDAGLAYFKDSTTRITRVVSNSAQAGATADPNPEPRHLVLAEFKQVLTPLGTQLAGHNPKRWHSVDKGKVRALLKYDPFTNSWDVASFDVGNPVTGAWETNNVGY